MTSKITLTVASILGAIFTLGFYLVPEFVTLQQFPNAKGQGLDDLITLRYALASLVACIVVITVQLRGVEGREQQKSIMLGYGIGFFIIFFTNLTLQLAGLISAIPPIVATCFISLLSFYTWWTINKGTE